MIHIIEAKLIHLKWTIFDKLGMNSKSYLADSILLINVSSETLDSLKWRFHQSSDRITAPTY